MCFSKIFVMPVKPYDRDYDDVNSTHLSSTYNIEVPEKFLKTLPISVFAGSWLGLDKSSGVMGG